MTQFRIPNPILLGLILALAAGTALSASNDGKSSPQPEALCSDAWFRSIEEKVPTGDGQGHGPDLGSDEWKSEVEFKLGIRDKPNVPGRDSQVWCRHIDQGSIWIPVSSPHEATSPSRDRATTTLITTTYNKFNGDGDPLPRQTVPSSPESILSHIQTPSPR